MSILCHTLTDVHGALERVRFLSLFLVGVGLVAGVGVGTESARADPPASSSFSIPPLVCFRITDIEDSFGDPEGDKFDVSVQFTNWSPAEAHRLRIDFTSFSNEMDGEPIFTSASIDPGGRPIGPASDDANFPPADGTDIPEEKVGVTNLWTDFSDPDMIDYRRRAPPFVPGEGVPARDVLGVPGPSNAMKTDQACALVPGCVLVGGLPSVPDLETVDNAGPDFDGGVDNTLDGFVMTIDEFDAGEYVSLNWVLVDVNNEPISSSFALGVLTFYRQVANENGDPLWGCNAGCPGNNTGTTASPLGIFDNVTSSGASFQIEAGLGITAPFRVPANNVFNLPTNVVPLSSLGPVVPAMGIPGLILAVGLMLGVGSHWLRRRR